VVVTPPKPQAVFREVPLTSSQPQTEVPTDAGGDHVNAGGSFSSQSVLSAIDVKHFHPVDDEKIHKMVGVNVEEDSATRKYSLKRPGKWKDWV